LHDPLINPDNNSVKGIDDFLPLWRLTSFLSQIGGNRLDIFDGNGKVRLMERGDNPAPATTHDP
jgi:hypothetical protein